MQFDVFVSKLKGVKQAGAGVLAFCPAHNNTNTQALSVSRGETGIVLKCHNGCETAHICESLGIGLSDLFYASRNGHTSNSSTNGAAPRPGLTLEQFASAKGLKPDFLRQMGVSEDKGSLVFHYLLMDGQRAPRQRIRLSLDGDKQFIWNKAEGRPVPYGLWQIKEARSRAETVLVLVEGESDALTLWHHVSQL